MPFKNTARFLCLPLLYSLLSLPSAAADQDRLQLQDLIELGLQRAERFEVFDLRKRGIELETRSRDLELTPRLFFSGSTTDDQRQSFSPTNRRSSDLFEFGVSKRTSLGSELQLRSGYEVAELSTQPGSPRHISQWEFSLSQSLWRNGLGRETRLRREGDLAAQRAEETRLQEERQSFILRLESLYWDYNLLHHEKKIRTENLRRAREIESWVRDRLRRAAAEETDLLQAQALVASRELQLRQLENRLERLLLEAEGVHPDLRLLAHRSPNLQELEQERSLRSLILGEESERGESPIRLDSLRSRALTESARVRADQIQDSLRPELNLLLTYGQNAIETQSGESWRRAVDGENPVLRYGITFSTELDRGLKDNARQAARLELQAREIEAQLSERESQTHWLQLQREVDNLRVRIQTARRLADFQQRKASQERQRYQQGRTTAFQAITFEQDAAEAQLGVFQLLAELRKLEGQARLFTVQRTL